MQSEAGGALDVIDKGGVEIRDRGGKERRRRGLALVVKGGQHTSRNNIKEGR